MATELSAEKNAFIAKLVAEGLFPDRRQALDRAADLLREEAETLDDIREGLASINRREGVPLDEAVDGLRRKHDFPKEP